MVDVAVTPATLHLALGAVGQEATVSVAVTPAAITLTAISPTAVASRDVVPEIPERRRLRLVGVSPTAEMANAVPQSADVSPAALALTAIEPTAAPSRSVAVTPATFRLTGVTPTVSV